MTADETRQPYHDPFNLTLPAYGNKGGIADQSDFNWDQSLIGNYEEAGLSASMPDLSTVGLRNAEGVQEGNDIVAGLQQKYGITGSAPMLATPNCAYHLAHYLC